MEIILFKIYLIIKKKMNLKENGFTIGDLLISIIVLSLSFFIISNLLKGDNNNSAILKIYNNNENIDY